MAKFVEDFKSIQDECKITIIKDGKAMTMTTKQFRQMMAKQKRDAKKKAQTDNVA